MDVIAIVFMLGAGAAIALLVMKLVGGAPRENARDSALPQREAIAATLLHHVVCAGGVDSDEALRRVRRATGVAVPVTSGIDVVNWAESYARAATREQRSQLLETAVQLVAAEQKPVPLRQYVALLDLSFGLGFQTDALARLREIYHFDYIDHAKDARPRSADRRAGATTLFHRDRSRPDLLRVLGLTEEASRQEISAAYRRLVRQHHPDRFHGAEAEAQNDAAARFIEITRAYEELILTHQD